MGKKIYRDYEEWVEEAEELGGFPNGNSPDYDEADNIEDWDSPNSEPTPKLIFEGEWNGEKGYIKTWWENR